MAETKAGVVTPKAGAIVKQEIGSSQLEVRGETAAVAVAAAQEALVKARCALAKHSPRDIEIVRTRILKDCDRPLFAEKAIYSKPVGMKLNKQTEQWEEQFIEGPSVRLAETIFRHMGNLFVDAMVVADDSEKRIIKVMCMDLETNATDAQDVTVNKTVERTNAKDRTILSERMNSYGRKTFTVMATDDELLNKVNSGVAKMRRNKILELSPIDIVEEAMSRCRQTTAKADAQDPDASKRRMIDAFAEVQVAPTDLRDWLGHDLEKVTPAELAQLRKIHAALDNEETTWTAVMEARGKATGTQAPPPLGTQMAATGQMTQTPPAPPPPAPTDSPKPETKPAQEAAPAPVANSTPPPAPPPPPIAAAQRELDPAEKEITEAFEKVSNRTQLMALVKLINRLPDGRKAEWRSKFNQRMSEIA